MQGKYSATGCKFCVKNSLKLNCTCIFGFTIFSWGISPGHPWKRKGWCRRGRKGGRGRGWKEGRLKEEKGGRKKEGGSSPNYLKKSIPGPLIWCYHLRYVALCEVTERTEVTFYNIFEIFYNVWPFLLQVTRSFPQLRKSQLLREVGIVFSHELSH